MYNFNALLSRLKYIPRWSLMRQSRAEDVAQHTADVALIAHTLCRLANGRFGRRVNGERVAVCALYHDVSEILTGDMPTPVKYNNAKLQSAYKDMEKLAAEKLMETAEPSVRRALTPYLTAENLTDYEKKLLKGADKLRALIKCIEEMQSGNREFESAYNSTRRVLQAMELDEVNFFMENMLEGYRLCLDELARI